MSCRLHVPRIFKILVTVVHPRWLFAGNVCTADGGSSVRFRRIFYFCFLKSFSAFFPLINDAHEKPPTLVSKKKKKKNQGSLEIGIPEKQNVHKPQD